MLLYKFILWNACQSIWWNTFVFLKMIFKMIINVQGTDGEFSEPLFLFWQVESLWGIELHVKRKVSVGFLFFHKYKLYHFSFINILQSILLFEQVRIIIKFLWKTLRMQTQITEGCGFSWKTLWTRMERSQNIHPCTVWSDSLIFI